MKKYYGFLIVLTTALFSCQTGPNQNIILGAWKVDSTYTYYNGFDYTQRTDGGDWATYVYEADGVMKEIKYGSFQSYFFEFEGGDTIWHKPTAGGEQIAFKILQLNQDHLVLKKSKNPIFSGGNQERYEVRYFSKTEMPEQDALPFTDPRK